MVNYSRMEDVWRSYGPLDPIGPKGSQRGVSRSKRVVVLGLAAVCGFGAALGLYLRPNLGAEPAEAAPAAPRLAEASSPSKYAAVTPRLEVMISELAGVLPTGGPLPSDLVPPSAAPTPYGAAPSGNAAAPPTMLMATITPVRPQPASPPTAARPVPGPAMAPAPVVARPQPALLPPQAPVTARGQAEPRVYPRTSPAVQRPIVLARREDAPVAMPQLPAVRDTPSFDCSRARGAGQQTVCGDPALTALDRQLAAELALAIAAGHDRARLQLDQDSWAARREAAAPDADAVADAYRRRIRQLRSMR